MADVVPLSVSGQIQPSQKAIIMTISDSTPYYLVTDFNDVPYFQPLYQDVTTGLAVFQNFATIVNVSVGGRGSSLGNSVTLKQLIGGADSGDFIINPNLLRIGAPNSIPGASKLIPIEKLSYADQNLVACGYEYVITGGYSFYITTNWSSTPHTQTIGNLTQKTPAISFYVFPVDELVDSHGNPASSTVYSTIYNDVLGKTTETFLFTSRNAWQIGGGEPYYFCPESQCGPNCYGTCNGKYEGCLRLKDAQFTCGISVSTLCKFLSVLPFLGVAIISLLAGFINYLVIKHKNLKRPLTKAEKIALSITLVIIPSIVVIVMVLLVSLDTNTTDKYLRAVCGARAVV